LEQGAVRGRRKHRRGNLLVLSAFGLAAIITVSIIGGGESFRAYDPAHQIEVTYQVRTASASSGGSTSSRGVGTLFDQVQIETADCGNLILRRGVTAQNKKEIAAGLRDAGGVEFRVGAGSYRWRDLLRVLRTPVIVSSFTPRS